MWMGAWLWAFCGNVASASAEPVITALAVSLPVVRQNRTTGNEKQNLYVGTNCTPVALINRFSDVSTLETSEKLYFYE